MKTLFEYSGLLLFLVAAACSRAVPSENILLNHPASASSSYDFNLTPQLLTDGAVESSRPVYLELVTSEGVVPKGEREFTLDSDIHSRNKINSDSGWLEYRFHNVDFSADEAEVYYQEALKGGRGGERIKVTVPVEYLDSTSSYRIGLEFPRKAGWRVQAVDFHKDGQPLGNLLPSRHFSSSWMSAGCGQEWVSVDMAEVRKVDSVRIHWLNRARQASLEISSDGVRWKSAGAVVGGSFEDVVEIGRRCRFIRLNMDGGTSDGQPYCITEIEAFGPSRAAGAPEGGWKIQRAPFVSASAGELSLAGFDTKTWVPATVPGTVLANYIRAGIVPDPDYADNVSGISESFFAGDFWYREEFEYAGTSPGKRVWLNFDGINWKAEVWLNGQRLGRMDGAFIRGVFDVTDILNTGRNALAVKVEYNANPGAVKEKNSFWTGYNGGVIGKDSPCFLASIGWDWMTTVRGRNCGIWNDVYLSETGPAKLSDPLVVSAVGADGRASMTPSVNLDGDLGGDVEVEGWIGDIRFSRKVTEGGQVAFPPEAFSQLRDREMRLWWPNGYGEAALYDAGFVVRVDGVMSDSLHYKAGIREVKAMADDGTLRLFVNGRRISPVGGNWGFCQQNLRFSERDYDISVAYHRQMNFNMIRNWVGQIEDEEFFAACDRYGIMVWQDFWLANPDDGPDPDDEAMFVANALDNTSRIRRHPCIVLYCGRNEGNPPATLDRALRDDVVGKFHPDIPYISNSADDLVSGHGPYNVESARYYFTHQSGKLHTERGMPTVLTLESMRRFLPEEDLWPRGDMWGKHDFTTSGPQRGETYMKMMSEAFGECSSAREFSALAQWINYDGYRAIFESSLSGGRMGVLLWMSHSCWPSMMWCTYDYYFQPTGAFFGSKKGCEKLHIFYNAATGGVEVANSGAGGYVALTAEAKLYGCRGNALWSGSVTLDSPEDSGVTAFDTLEFPGGEEVYLLRLELKDAEGALLSDNFYMMGKEEGNLRALRGLRAAELKKTERRDGPNNIKVTLRNDDSVPALMVRLVLLDRSGEELLPVDYSDNYISLLPGEERTVEIGWRNDSCSEPAFVDVIQMGDFQLR